ncbi:uroporphyrinogen decarboxylase family protein [Burkholderia sp. MR1-5-21]
MDHWQRIEAAASGERADRIPVSLWRHFPECDLDAGKLAGHTLAWQRKWEFDLVKFMPSGTYGVEDWGAVTAYEGAPNGARNVLKPVIYEPEEWTKLARLDVTKGFYAQQNQALRTVARELGGRVPLLQTVFSPLTTARKLAGDKVLTDLRCNPGALEAGLRVITDVTIDFSLAAIDAGAHGVFFASQLATSRHLTTDEYGQFGRRYDFEVLEALRGKSRLNMLHAHGDDIMFPMLAEYPVDMLNWHDRLTKPSLKMAATAFPKMLVGGLNEHQTILRGGPDAIAAEVSDAIAQTEGRRLMIGPGCALPLATSEENIQAVLDAAEKGALDQ